MLASVPTPAGAAVAISLTAMMAFSRTDFHQRIELPRWLPWAFLVLLGIASVWFALGHPDVLLEPSLELSPSALAK